MLLELANSPLVKVLELGYYAISVVLLVAWVVILAFLFSVGAVQVGGLFLLLTIFIAVVAFVNERMD